MQKQVLCLHRSLQRKVQLAHLYEGARDFLTSRYFSDSILFGYDITFDNSEGLVNILWEREDWKTQVLGKKGVAKYNVNTFTSN